MGGSAGNRPRHPRLRQQDFVLAGRALGASPLRIIRSYVLPNLMATIIVLVGCYYGYTASGGPVGVGSATAKSMVLNIVGVHLVNMLGTQLFWGANPRAPIGG